MKIGYSSTMVFPASTSTEHTKWKLTLEAEGTFIEIEWYKKQLDKIGEAKEADHERSV
jgi:hypothetical protein